MAKFTLSSHGLTVTTDFDNGCLSRAEILSSGEIDCWIMEPADVSERGIFVGGSTSMADACDFGYHFRIDGARGRTLRVKIHSPREFVLKPPKELSMFYANPAGPVVSSDGDHWRSAKNKTLHRDGAHVTIEVCDQFESDSVYFAHQHPYSAARLSRFSERISPSPLVKFGRAGTSTEGRAIPSIRLSEGKADSKPLVVVTGLQHCGEHAAGWGIEGMIEYLLSDQPRAKTARATHDWLFIPIVNIDALIEGRGRLHSTGKNLNREWEGETSVPEIASIIKTLDGEQRSGHHIAALLDQHGFSTARGMWGFYVPKLEDANAMEKHLRFVECFRNTVPQAYITDAYPGMTCTGAAKRWGAVSFTIDGWVFNREWDPAKVGDVRKCAASESASLRTHYEAGRDIFPLEEVRASGRLFIDAWLDFCGL
ncbi:MAG TPA: M14 family zinc carboxypeptidase [Planctomycetota bacterium]|nr:M14 family zinc carboxypeptidase [Planctomycetota bacterium]